MVKEGPMRENKMGGGPPPFLNPLPEHDRLVGMDKHPHFPEIWLKGTFKSGYPSKYRRGR